MSEEIPSSRPRPVRILALHAGPSRLPSQAKSTWTASQSAASYRAQLAPLINALPPHWEMHFLEAGFAVDPEAADQSNGSSASGSAKRSRGEKIRQALLDCSLLDALGGEVESEKARRAMVDKTHTSPASTSSQSALSPVEEQLASLRKSLAETDDEARSEAFRIYTRSGLDDAESLLMAEGMLAPDRDWFIPTRRTDAAGPAVIGLQSSLARVGDYLREKGPFHIGIGSGSGYEVLSLVSALLRSAASSSSSSQAMQPVLSYPLLFPLLPLTAPAPRMGGWEVLPSLPLPNGRRRALCQGGLHVLVRIGEGVPVLKENFWQGEWEKWADTGAGESIQGNGDKQKEETWRIGLVPLSGASSSNGQETTASASSDEHLRLSPSSASSTAGAANSATLLTSSTTTYLASTLRKLCFHLEVVPGLEPAEARAVARARAREEAQEEEKRGKEGGGGDGVSIGRDLIGPFLRERARQDAMDERGGGKI